MRWVLLLRAALILWLLAWGAVVSYGHYALGDPLLCWVSAAFHLVMVGMLLLTWKATEQIDILRALSSKVSAELDKDTQSLNEAKATLAEAKAIWAKIVAFKEEQEQSGEAWKHGRADGQDEG